MFHFQFPKTANYSKQTEGVSAQFKEGFQFKPPSQFRCSNKSNLMFLSTESEGINSKSVDCFLRLYSYSGLTCSASSPPLSAL